MDLRKALKIYLQKNDLTQAFCARKVGLSPPTLFKWINGEYELKTDVLIRIKHFMDGDFLLSVNDIMEGDADVYE